MRVSRLVAAAVAVLAVAPAAAAGPGLRVGAVEDAAIWEDPAAQTDLAKLAGFDTVRMTAQWSNGTTQLPPGQTARLQRAAMLASMRGIEPIVSIYNVGAATTPTDDSARAQFAQFAADTVRTLPWVRTFIVGNEPNSSLYWRPQFDGAGGDAAAAAYERLLAQTYDAIKAARPTATVVGGALDSHGADDPAAARQTHSPTEFIRDLGAAYRASGRTAPIMDVFDEHVYADNSALPPSMPHAGGAIAAGDYRKLVVEALKLALCAPNVVGILNFHVVDERALSGWQSGPFYADGTPKSSFATIRDAIAAVHAGTLARCPDTSAPTAAISLGSGTVSAAAGDDVGVGKVELVVDGAVAGVRFAPPYRFALPPRRTRRSVVEVRAYDAAGNVGGATTVVGARRLAAGRTFTWRAPKSGRVTFASSRRLTIAVGRHRFVGVRIRFTARRGAAYRISAARLPLSWRS